MLLVEWRGEEKSIVHHDKRMLTKFRQTCLWVFIHERNLAQTRLSY